MIQRFFLVFLTLLLAAGCSNSSKSILPVTPGIESDIMSESPIVTETSISGDLTGTGILGSYGLTIDPKTMDVELYTNRNASIGESYTVSGGGFFTGFPCHDCLKISRLELTEDGNAVIRFLIRHPFEPGVSTKPITWLNRLDLDIFDVALVIAPQKITPTAFPLTGNAAYSGIIGNASGYTREIKGITSDSAALPYVLVVDDDVAGTSTFNRFAMGAVSYFDVMFDMKSNESATFSLYLTFGYGASAKKPQRLNPTYYNPEFNRKSAWKVNVIPPQGENDPTIYNTWNDRNTSEIHNVRVEVFDWQIDAVVDSDLTIPSHVRTPSEVLNVMLELPGMTNSVSVQTEHESGSGAPGDPLVYNFPIANELGLSAGEYTGLVKVYDQRVPGVVSQGYEVDTLVHSKTGLSLEWFNIPEYSTYQTFTATVLAGCGPISGSITSPESPVTGISSGQTIVFYSSVSSGNDGDPITLIEWDQDYDGVTFTVDNLGETALLGPFMNPTCGLPESEPYTYTVAVRATDSCSPPNVVIFDTIQVVVDSCNAPTATNPILIVNRELVSQDYPIDDQFPFSIYWNIPSGAIVEYAIYGDHDPSDGLTNNLVLIGTTTSSSFNCPASELPSNHYIPGYTYIIRGRTEIGKSETEGNDSDPVHVILTGFETLSSATLLNGEGWKSNCEGTNPNRIYRPQVSGTNRAHGNRSVHFSEFVGQTTTAGRWNGMTIGPLPEVPNSNVRFIDFSVYWKNMHDGGLVIGTCSTKPELNWTTIMDEYDAGMATNAEGYFGYTTYDTNICDFLNGCESTLNNCWYIPSTLYTHNKVGGNANLFGDANDPYIGIECFRNSYASQLASNIYLDEVAIAIY